MKNSSHMTPYNTATKSVIYTLVSTLLFFLLLETWKPYFFLDGDNLAGVLGSFRDIGTSLISFRLPEKFNSLYNGNFSLLEDYSSLTIWHPLHLLSAVIATTRYAFWSIEILCLINSLLATGFMALTIQYIAEKYKYTVHPVTTVLISLSYNFSFYFLIIGPVWFSFLGNQAAICIISAGLFAKSKKWGVLLVFIGMFHNMFGGHLSPFLYSIFFISVWTVGLSFIEKSWDKVIRLVLGGSAVLILSLPLLIIYCKNFIGSERHLAYLPEIAQQHNIPFFTQVTDFTFGFLSLWIQQGFVLPNIGHHHVLLTMGGFAFLVICIFSKKWTRPEILTGLLLLMVMLFIDRPNWLQSILSNIPLYRSLRWPIRECIYSIFFAHILLAMRWHKVKPYLRRSAFIVGILFFLMSILLRPLPSIAPFDLDRDLLLSGKADVFWRLILKDLNAPFNPLIIPLVKNSIADQYRPAEIDRMTPHVMTGAYNYPPLLQMRSVTGYTMSGGNYRFEGIQSYFCSGYFKTQEYSAINKTFPETVITELMSLYPITIKYTLGQRSLILVYSDEDKQFIMIKNEIKQTPSEKKMN